MTPPRRPGGIPIGRALDIPTGLAYDDFREAVDAINRVHGDGELPRISVRLVSDAPYLGRFHFDVATGDAFSIMIRANQRFRRLTLLHEIGHLLDWSRFGDGSFFGTTTNPALRPWAAAIIASRAFRELDEIAKRAAWRIDEQRIVVFNPARARGIRVAIQPEELWARSYAQYVTTRSGLPQLRQDLQSVRSARGANMVYLPLQWDDLDFAPIATAIDALFETLEWRR